MAIERNPRAAKDRRKTAKQVFAGIRRDIDARMAGPGITGAEMRKSLQDCVKHTPNRYEIKSVLGLTDAYGVYKPTKQLTSDECEAVIQCFAWCDAWNRTPREYAETFGRAGYAEISTEQPADLFA